MQALQILLLSCVLDPALRAIEESIARPRCPVEFGSTAVAKEIGVVRGNLPSHYLSPSSSIVSYCYLLLPPLFTLVSSHLFSTRYTHSSLLSSATAPFIYCLSSGFSSLLLDAHCCGPFYRSKEDARNLAKINYNPPCPSFIGNEK